MQIIKFVALLSYDEYLSLTWEQILGVGVKVHGVPPGAPGSYLTADSTNRMQFGNSSFDGQGLAAKISKDRSVEALGDHSAGKIAGKTMEHGGSSLVTNANMVLLPCQSYRFSIFKQPFLHYSL